MVERPLPTAGQFAALLKIINDEWSTGHKCAETGEPVEFRTTHDYRTDTRWRYASGAVCKHRIVRGP